MSKSILVIDTPRDCFGCPCYSSREKGVYFCNKQNRIISKQDIAKYKPDWCPLQDLPEKKRYEVLSDTNPVKAWGNGWNAYIDKLLEGDGSE